MSDGCAETVLGRSGLEVRAFGPATEGDAMAIINAYTAGWHYSRPVEAELIAHWQSLGGEYQPDKMLIAYREGVPRAFLHGQAEGEGHYLHLLAMVPGAVEEGVWLLEQAEGKARAAGGRRLCGPTCRSGRFYGGYLLGLEPYHPHWAVDGTEAFVRAGFSISQSEVLMVAEPAVRLAEPQIPAGYSISEVEAEPEFQARSFRLAALHEQREVATCGARLYPQLTAPGGGPVGQLGFVGTAEQHRGKGLGTALVMLALKRLYAWGASEVLVSTGLENTSALRVYERAGFRRKHNLNEWSKMLE